MLIEIIFLQEFSKDLSSNLHQLPAKVILIQRIGFSKKKNSSWINLHHLYSIFIFIFFTFLIMNKSSYFQKKKIKIFNSLKKFKISKFFKKKKSSIKIFNSFKKFKFSKFKKKKKKSLLNSSTGTESYDLLPHSPVMQH